MSGSVLRIKVRCPAVSSAAVALEGCTQDTTFADFRSKVMMALGLERPPAGDRDGDEAGEGRGGGTAVDLPTILAGFPPKPLDLPDDAAIGSVLSDNENVTVRLPSQPAGAANPEGGSWGRSRKKAKDASSSASTSSSSSSTRASTRASRSGKSSKTDDGANGSSAATTSKALAGNTKKGKAKSKPKERKSGAASTAAATGSSSGRGGGGGVHTLNGTLTPSPASASRRTAGASSGWGGGGHRAGSSGEGRTLFGGPSDGSAGGGSVTGAGTGALEGAAEEQPTADGPSRKRMRPGTGVALRSESDIGETLLRAVSGGGQGVADKFFRKAMRLAVEKQYDQSRADARVRAAMGKWYTLEADAGQRRLGDGQSVAMKVSFSKGDGAKSQFEETVDRIPLLQVAAVVRMIARDPESREMLKPHNMAGCSPRMFWSLVLYWSGDVPAALRRAAPDLDWSFLGTRDRKPSEKAVANAITEEMERRQAQEEKEERERVKVAKREAKERTERQRKGVVSDTSGGEAEPVAVVGGAADLESSTGASAGTVTAAEEQTAVAEIAPAQTQAQEARRRAADAALSRLAAARQTVSESKTTDGGASIIASQPAAEEVEIDMEGLEEIAGGRSGAKLLVAAGVRTVGQLADRDEEKLACELEALQVGGAISGGSGGEGGSAAVAGAGGAGDGANERRESEKKVGAEKVSEWVQAARGEELDEIMFEIVGSDDDVVEALEEVFVATPRDLVRLGAFPDILIATLRDKLGNERFAPLAGSVTLDAVKAWRDNGNRVLEQRPWLERWVTE